MARGPFWSLRELAAWVRAFWYWGSNTTYTARITAPWWWSAGLTRRLAERTCVNM
jgi:hypothetical protein